MIKCMDLPTLALLVIVMAAGAIVGDALRGGMGHGRDASVGQIAWATSGR